MLCVQRVGLAHASSYGVFTVFFVVKVILDAGTHNRYGPQIHGDKVYKGTNNSRQPCIKNVFDTHCQLYRHPESPDARLFH